MEEERPPERIWLDDEALEEHFERLAEQRKSGSNFEAVPESDMSTNELTANFKK